MTLSSRLIVPSPSPPGKLAGTSRKIAVPSSRPVRPRTLQRPLGAAWTGSAVTSLPAAGGIRTGGEFFAHLATAELRHQACVRITL
jgi:hypothetical protein